MRRTNTTLFLVPMVVRNREMAKTLGQINGYIADVDKDISYERAVYVLFKPDHLEAFNEFLLAEKESEANIVDDYDYDGGYVVVVYKFNKKYEADYKLILEGRYSEVSEAFKTAFPKVAKVKVDGVNQDQLSVAYMAITKLINPQTGEPFLKEYWEEQLNVTIEPGAEFWGVFDTESEVLDIEKVRKEIEEEQKQSKL